MEVIHTRKREKKKGRECVVPLHMLQTEVISETSTVYMIPRDKHHPGTTDSIGA